MPAQEARPLARHVSRARTLALIAWFLALPATALAQLPEPRAPLPGTAPEEGRPLPEPDLARPDQDVGVDPGRRGKGGLLGISWLDGTSRLSVEAFAGYLPGATALRPVAVSSPEGGTRVYGAKSALGGSVMSGLILRFDVVPWARLAATGFYSPGPGRSVAVLPGIFGQPGRDHPAAQPPLGWHLSGGGLGAGRLGAELAPLRTRALSLWIGGGAAAMRTDAAVVWSQDHPGDPAEAPLQFVEPTLSPGAYATVVVQVPVSQRFSLNLSADHQWLRLDVASEDRGLAAHFEEADAAGGGEATQVRVDSEPVDLRHYAFRIGLGFRL